MPELTAARRKYLRGLAHQLKPLVLIGQKGVSKSLIEAVDDALELHELIKLKFNDFKDEKATLAKDIEANTHSEIVGMIGNVAIFYRQQPDRKKRKIQLP
ncbi:ribosome assembly RNA-binding protein YhbY [candidate division KSB3 bacterium]|uniref:Ribosome assembly RNA-binding protein YhbY n=1 Tax=candidate division KSB3 bacterium TaxID=2044937 RepID=A0A2G6E628_9BACT|nr:MAG: ribosome assembly RNA-binding protein YhbY [candidate division KSB3 bacterium]PIE30041.1 MAG: ribosome assembly RNA-binding protein YhbY [candidate division KSB3 bacterium]